MATFISHSAAETEALGEAWSKEALEGSVIALSGELGAGKTQLVRGIARGLGVSERVHSPSFTIVNEYSSGRLPLHHLDLYRLETREQIAAAGLEDYLFEPSGISVIEWAERWFIESDKPNSSLKPKRYRRVRIETLSENERRITYEDPGD